MIEYQQEKDGTSERRRTKTCTMDKQHVLVHAACPCSCCMSVSMLQGLEHAALTWTCSMDMDKQHGD
jgi:hypothetical protein